MSWGRLRFVAAALMGCQTSQIDRNPPRVPEMSVNPDQPGQSPTVWSAPVDGLRLGIAARDSEIELSLQNVGTEPLEVLSHVQAQEIHLDWFRLVLNDGEGRPRELRLMEGRDKAGPVRVRLEPGASLQHRVSPAAWAVRPINGSRPLRPGTYHVTARYETLPGGDTWAGRLEAGPTVAEIGTQRGTRDPTAQPE